jgi:predicted ATPase/DNA-binding SARP family transcriptional activator
MLYRVLGPLEVEVGTQRITLPGTRPRALLVALLLHPNAAVPASRLVEAVWGDDVPDNATNALHQAVRRLRSHLGPQAAAIRTRAEGYLLEVDGDAIDAERFEADYRRARRLAMSDATAAVAVLGQALALWRGPAYAEFADGFARAPAIRLEELRIAALEDRAELMVTSGAVSDAVAGARELVAAEPLRDRPVEVLMRALDADGRPAEALEAYRRHRELLADELGLDPSAELRRLETAVLRGEAIAPRRPPSPPPRGAPVPSSGRLPWRPGGLLGRQADLGLLLDCLDAQRFVTLAGPGGVGKTRLALEAAHGLATAGRNVWWSDLSAVDPSRLVDALAETAAVEPPRGADRTDSLCAALRAHRGVLCLDNAETVLDALAPVAERLAAAAPELALLVTSRERLAVAQEHVHVLAPLPLPGNGDRENPAVRLFVERAPGLEAETLSDDDVQVIAETCRRLDGLPLAIELGAARAPTFGLAAFAERLGRGLDLLVGGRRTAAHRHRSVRAVVDWSYGLLTADEARLFARLAVFPGAFDLDQAEHVCADEQLPRPSVGPLLARLVDQSLVQAGQGRFWLLETLRTYARERLDAADEAVLRGRHAADTARRLAALDPQLAGPEEPAAVAGIAMLSADLHAAWSYAREHDRPLAVQCAADANFYAYHRQRLDLLEWGLEVADWEIEHPRLGDALASAAAAAWATGRVGDASVLADRGVAAAGGADSPAAARAMNQCACVAMFTSRTADAVDRFARAGALFRAAGDPVRGLMCDVSVCQVMSYGGAAAEAAARMPDLVARARDTANPSLLAWAHYVLGEALADIDRDRAAAAWASAMEHGRQADSRLFVNLARTSAVASAAEHGSPATALDEFEQVLDQWEAIGSQAAQWWVLVNLVVLLTRLGAFDDAARLAGAAIAARDRHPALARDRRRLAEALGTVRERLGDRATDEGLAVGAGLPLSAAVALGRAAIRRES